MRYAFLGDIHSNLTALDTVLRAIDQDAVDCIVSVGDVVGYGAAPQACIRQLRDREVLVVQGNHDAACTGHLNDDYFNDHARKAVRWTRDALNADELDWLSALPLTLELEHCHVSHGTLHRPEDFGYIQTTSEADPSLDVMTRPVCFVGHTHVPVTMMRLRHDPDRTAYTFEEDIDLEEADRTLINVGSVGQPRDEDPRTGYALFDSETRRVLLRRLEYDVAREAARIRKAGLPDILAERLFLGL